MSSFPIFSNPTAARPFFAEPCSNPQKMFTTAIAKFPPEVVRASRLEVRPTPEFVSTGVPQVDALTGGFPRGCMTEVCGPNSSGRTSLLLAALLAATRRAEVCALVDVSDAFDPASTAEAGVDFQKLLWVRCGEKHRTSAPRSHRNSEKNSDRIEQALRVTDLLLQSGGFGLVAIDLADVPFKMARRIPVASWFRFRRAVEHTSTVLLLITPAPCTQSCAALLLKMQAEAVRKKPSAHSPMAASELPSHAELLRGFHVNSEILRSRLQRKPVKSVAASFTTKAVRAG
jgi:hypothetical protein